MGFTLFVLYFCYFRSHQSNQVEEERNEISKERDSCSQAKAALEQEKTRLKQEIREGVSIVENSKGQLNQQQNTIVSIVYLS